MSYSTQEIATPKACKKFIRPKMPPTKMITYCATLVAASILMKMLGQTLQFNGFKISLVYIPWILSGILLGPIGGALVGFASDLLGTFVLPTGGAPIPLIVLGNTLFPFIVGLVTRLMRGKNKNLAVMLGTFLAILVCTLGLNSYALARLYNIPYFSYLVVRLPQILIVTLNAVVVVLLLPLLKKANLTT